MNKIDLIIDALEHCKGLTRIDRAHLKKALVAARELQAEEQEPVAWEKSYDIVCALLRQAHDILATTQYPIKRPWVSLTDDEIHKIVDDHTSSDAQQDELNDFAKAVFAAEVKLKEKNT